MNTRWRILCYHDIGAHQVSSFTNQIDAWLSAGWQFCTIGEGLVNGPAAAERRMTLSFDDGGRSIRDVLAACLHERNIRPCLYVTADYVERGETYRDANPRPALRWDELRELAHAGAEIGSHGLTHLALPRCSETDARRELTESRQILEQHLDRAVHHFSYPFGQHAPWTGSLIRQIGVYDSAATIDRGDNLAPVPLSLQRDLVNPAWSAQRMRVQIGLGRVPLFYRIQRRLRGIPVQEAGVS